jgi:SAM-dependent methyltransferase
LVPIVAAVAALAYGVLRRGLVRELVANLQAFDLPSAWLYDALAGALLERFYDRVAAEVAAARPVGRVLDVGSGPGRLAVRLAQVAPRLEVHGVDIARSMVARATRRAERAGLSDRVRFTVGDAARLPFPEAHFDGVVSTLTLHHLKDPARALAEVHRVLKPGGEVWIYDLADGLLGHGLAEEDLTRLAVGSPFRGGTVEVVHWPGPVPAFRLLHLRRPGPSGS